MSLEDHSSSRDDAVVEQSGESNEAPDSPVDSNDAWSGYAAAATTTVISRDALSAEVCTVVVLLSLYSTLSAAPTLRRYPLLDRKAYLGVKLELQVSPPPGANSHARPPLSPSPS